MKFLFSKVPTGKDTVFIVYLVNSWAYLLGVKSSQATGDSVVTTVVSGPQELTVPHTALQPQLCAQGLACAGQPGHTVPA